MKKHIQKSKKEKRDKLMNYQTLESLLCQSNLSNCYKTAPKCFLKIGKQQLETSQHEQSGWVECKKSNFKK